MRNFLFDAVAKTCAVIIVTTQWVAGLHCKVVGNIGHFLMGLIDKSRLAGYEALLEGEETGELQQQGLELKLLVAAQQVRDHARETDEWTDRHTDALNAIGEALMNEAQWEEQNVHAYLKELVESIDGLEYGTEEW